MSNKKEAPAVEETAPDATVLATEATPSPAKAKCGLVMPISTIDDCTSDHWGEVKSIIIEAIRSIKDPEFEVALVSDADDSGVIQKRIVQNVYNSDIVVCDVSCKNPNVMLELGMRLAFDKPTVIIKDDKTAYPFDINVIEYVQYPRDLRFGKVVDFKEALAKKVKSTYEAAKKDTSYSTFLKHFGTFTVAKIDEKEVSPDQAILSKLQDIEIMLQNQRKGFELNQMKTQKSFNDLSVSRIFRQNIKEYDEKEEIRSFILDYLNGINTSNNYIITADKNLLRILDDKFNPPGIFPTKDEYDKFLSACLLLKRSLNALGDQIRNQS